MQTRGIDRVTRVLEGLFGEEIRNKSWKNRLGTPRPPRAKRTCYKEGIGMVPGLASSSAAIPIPRNTFYGDEQ